MKIGMRTPSISRSIKASTTGRVKRTLKSYINPAYGKKGMGIINNPKKAVYNKVYNKTTVDSLKIFRNNNSSTNHQYANEENKYITKLKEEYKNYINFANNEKENQTYIKGNKVKYFSKEATCCICNKDLGLFTFKSRIQLYDGWLCSKCCKKIWKFGITIKRKKDTKDCIKNIYQYITKKS